MKPGSWQIEKPNPTDPNPMRVRMKISGAIDAHFDFPDVNTFKPGTELEIDLTDFGSMDSVGIRDFIAWHQKLGRQVHFTFWNAPPTFISLASIVSGLIPSPLSLKTFEILYSSIDGDDIIKHKITQTEEGRFLIPKRVGDYELDHIPAKDFRVLGGHYALV